MEQNRELLEQTSEETLIATGRFYSSIDQVWDTDGKPLDSERSWVKLRRDKCPTFSARLAKSEKNGYELTKEGAFRTDTTAADAPKQARSSMSGSTSPHEIWPTDIFGNKNHGEMAHLVLSSSRNASVYMDVALCALGDCTNPPWEIVQKMIHGSQQQGTGSRTRASNTLCRTESAWRVRASNWIVCLVSSSCLS